MKSKLSRIKYNYLQLSCSIDTNFNFKYEIKSNKGLIKRYFNQYFYNYYKVIKVYNFLYLKNSNLYTFLKIILNDIKGCLFGWVCVLVIKGLGYKSFISNKELKLDIGYSHYIKYIFAININMKCKNNNIYLFSIYKDKLFNIAKILCTFRERGPYKYKGIFFKDEIIKLKAGKQK